MDGSFDPSGFTIRQFPSAILTRKLNTADESLETTGSALKSGKSMAKLPSGSSFAVEAKMGSRHGPVSRCSIQMLAHFDEYCAAIAEDQGGPVTRPRKGTVFSGSQTNCTST